MFWTNLKMIYLSKLRVDQEYKVEPRDSPSLLKDVYCIFLKEYSSSISLLVIH